jgi:cytochrome c oxidase subunit 4/cytochrome o ubiquinol oxidase operon protein cyoD
MADHDTAVSHHEEHHEAHGTGFYWQVGGVLAVVTAAEVAAFVYRDLFGHVTFLILLFCLMFAKGIGVVLYFMHLRGDARIFQFVFIVPFTLAVSMVLAFMVLFSHHVGIAG